MFKSLIIIAVLSSSLFAFAKPQAIPGEFIVKMRRGVSAKQAFSSAAVRQVAKKAKKIKGSNGRFVRVQMKPSLVTQGVRAFSSNPAFEYIEPNYLLTLPKFKVNGVINKFDVPADKMFDRLWGLNNKDHGHDIGALNAWKTTKGSRKVVVAVIDTGIDYNHPDLKANMWVNQAEANGKKGVDDDGNGVVDDIHGFNAYANTGDPMDGHSHGTHCAGTIGAVHNAIGVAGVTANVRMMAVKIFSDAGRTTSAAILEGIYYAADNGAHVLSNSWGGGPASQATKEAIEYVNKKGSIFVAAAGNDYKNNDGRNNYPSGYEVDNIVAVAAHGITGNKADFSNYGAKTVDVAAPGKDILSTIPNGKYASYSGTSMATPHVSGVLALLLSLNKEWVNKRGSKKNLDLSPKAVRDLLIKTSKKHEALNKKTVSNGYVRVDQLIKAAVSGLRR